MRIGKWMASIALLVAAAPPLTHASSPTPQAPPAQPNRGGQQPSKASMPVYATPYYNSEGLKISVGEQSKQLAAADAKTILQISNDFKAKRDTLRAEVMYVLAIRLYDLGQKDEAVYWFYTAQYRARVFTSILDPKKVGSIGTEAFELTQAYNSFNQLAGIYINGYGFGDLAKLEKTLATVVEESKALPKYGELYPTLSFVPDDTWAQKNKDVSTGLSGLIESIKTNADSIREERKKNGTDGKY